MGDPGVLITEDPSVLLHKEGCVLLGLLNPRTPPRDKGTDPAGCRCFMVYLPDPFCASFSTEPVSPYHHSIPLNSAVGMASILLSTTLSFAWRILGSLRVPCHHPTGYGVQRSLQVSLAVWVGVFVGVDCMGVVRLSLSR